MMRLFVTAMSVAAMLVVALPAEAQARACARFCSDGVCWYDCSKIPGQKNTLF